MPLRSTIALGMIAVCIAAIAYFGLITKAALPDHPLIRGNNDLILHFLAFAALTVPFCLLLGVRLGSAAVWTFIVLLEAAQILIPGRQASVEDLLSGGTGWLLCVAVFLAVQKVR